MTRVVAGATQAPGPHDDTGAPALTSTPRRNAAAHQLYASNAAIASNCGIAGNSGMSHTAEHPPAAACGGQCLGIVRRRSSRTVACGSSPVGNPGRCQCPLRKKDEASTCSCLGVGVRTIYLSNARPKARTRRRRLARIGLPGTCATGASRARRRNRVRPRVHATLRHSGGRSWR